MNLQDKTETQALSGRPTPHWLKRRKSIRWLIFALLAVWLIRDERASWDEEVQLSDGRVITITQKRRYGSVYDGNSYGSHMVREAWIWLRLPEVGDQEIEWRENLIPMRLDVVDGKPFIVAYPATGEESRLYGNPSPPYLGFRYENRNWKQLAVPAIPLNQYDANLVTERFVPWRARPMTLKRKSSKEFNGNPDIAKGYKHLDPELVGWK